MKAQRGSLRKLTSYSSLAILVQRGAVESKGKEIRRGSVRPGSRLQPRLPIAIKPLFENSSTLSTSPFAKIL